MKSCCVGQTGWLMAMGISLAPCATVLAGPYFLPLGTLPGRNQSHATAISRDGSVVVGYAGFASSGSTEAFRWTMEGGMVGLGGLPGWDSDSTLYSRAVGVSADGSVVIGFSDSTLRPNGEAFHWNAKDGMQSIITHGSSSASFRISSANAISDDGGIIYGGGQAFNNGLYSFRSQNGGFQQTNRPLPYGVSSDGVFAAGNRLAIPGPGTSSAFRDDWSGTASIALGDFPGGAADATALDISANGNVIVGWGTTSFGQEPFRWTEAEGMQSLGPLPAVFSNGARANAISADGSTVVGEGRNGVGGAFIWTRESGYRLLDDVLRIDLELDLQDWLIILSASDISGDGLTITGYGVNPSGRFEAFVARIPSPGTGALLLVGLVAAGIRRSPRATAGTTAKGAS